jgi:hypothetical protein
MANFPVVQGMGDGLQAALQKKVKVQTPTAGGSQHIKFGAYNGEWTFGRDNEPLNGEEVIVITPAFVHGWHLWVDRDVTKVMASFLQDRPEKPADREDRKGKVQSAAEAFGMQCVLRDGDDNIQMSYEACTDGARRAIGGLIDAVRSRAMEEPEFLYPKVVMGHDKPYENAYKDGEMIYPPTFEIVGWCNEDGEDEDAPVEKLAAPKKKKAAAEPEPEPEEVEEEEGEEEAEEEAPRQRRRSRG